LIIAIILGRPKHDRQDFAVSRLCYPKNGLCRNSQRTYCFVFHPSLSTDAPKRIPWIPCQLLSPLAEQGCPGTTGC
jgi:hypothetical protein